MTKEEYRKASHFRDATKMVAAPGSLSGLFDSAPRFGYASCVGRDGRRGLGGPILRRVAACRSIERRFCWLRTDAPLKQGCIEVSAYGRGLWGTERCAVP